MKKLSKVFALVLALAMLLSVTASFADEASDDLMSPYGKYPETITMTTVKSSDTNPKWPAGDDLDNNVMTRYIADKLNVVTKTNWEVESSEYVNKLSLDIVADSLPDMFTLSNENYLVYRQLLENGMLADLTEAYDKCAGWYMKDTAASFNGVHFAPYTEDGKLMGIPTGRYGYEHNQLWLRTDVLDAIGMTAEQVQTLDDIEEYLTKGIAAFPDSVGLALNATDPLTNYGTSYSADQIAMLYGATPRYWIEQEDGSITYGSIMPGMKQALGVLSDWYKKGLIDKEFATRTGNGLTQALTTGGQALAWFAPWWYGWSIIDLPTNVPGADVTIVNAPVDANGTFNVPWPSPAGTTLFISKKCATPEAAIKMINCEYDMWRGFDAEAKTALENSQNKDNDTYLDVSWGYLFPTGGVNMEYSDAVPTFGHALRQYCDTGDPSGLSTPAEITESMNVKKFIDGTYEQGRGSYYARYVASCVVDAENVNIIYPAYSQVTESMADLQPSLLTLEQTTVLQIIMGEKDLDSFDEFAAQWLAEGGQTLIDEVTAMVKK